MLTALASAYLAQQLVIAKTNNSFTVPYNLVKQGTIVQNTAPAYLLWNGGKYTIIVPRIGVGITHEAPRGN